MQGALNSPWAENVVPHLCKTQWGAWGTVRNSQAANIDYSSELMGKRKPALSITWAAGFSYGKVSAYWSLQPMAWMI